MNKQEKIKLIYDLVNHYKEIQHNMEGMISFVGGDYESPLPNAVFKAFDSYVDLVEKHCGENYFNSHWVSWFIFENDCGDRGFECVGTDKKKKKIKTVKDLVEFVET